MMTGGTVFESMVSAIIRAMCARGYENAAENFERRCYDYSSSRVQWLHAQWCGDGAAVQPVR